MRLLRFNVNFVLLFVPLARPSRTESKGHLHVEGSRVTCTLYTHVVFLSQVTILWRKYLASFSPPLWSANCQWSFLQGLEGAKAKSSLPRRRNQSERVQKIWTLFSTFGVQRVDGGVINTLESGLLAADWCIRRTSRRYCGAVCECL